MKCHVTGCNGTPLYRINEKGVPGVWACPKHLPQQGFEVDPEVREITEIIEEGNRG